VSEIPNWTEGKSLGTELGPEITLTEMQLTDEGVLFPWREHTFTPVLIPNSESDPEPMVLPVDPDVKITLTGIQRKRT
jgi:hypothetical protein